MMNKNLNFSLRINYSSINQVYLKVIFLLTTLFESESPILYLYLLVSLCLGCLPSADLLVGRSVLEHDGPHPFICSVIKLNLYLYSALLK